MPRIARFILASRQVVGFDSCPKIEMSPSRPPCASMNFSLLHEHAARAAARVVDAALVRREHLDQQAHDARGV